MSRVLTAAFNISFVLLQIDPRQIVEEAQRRTMTQSQRYEGTLRVIDAKNKITEKRWQYDRIGSHGSSKAVLRFTAPAEVKGVALLVLNHPDRSSDQWMLTPALNPDQGIWTAHQIDMHDLKRNSHTILRIEKLQYNVPMKDDAFTREALSRES